MVKSGKSGEEFVKSYEKPNTYNGYLVAVNHYLDFLGLPRLALKQKRRAPDALIIPPKVEEMKRVIADIKDVRVKTYIVLCATVGLRSTRLLKAKWSEIDFENGFVNINERHGKKVYRPNPLHTDVANLLREMRKTRQDERVFSFTYEKVQNALRAVNTSIRPNKLQRLLLQPSTQSRHRQRPRRLACRSQHRHKGTLPC